MFPTLAVIGGMLVVGLVGLTIGAAVEGGPGPDGTTDDRATGVTSTGVGGTATGTASDTGSDPGSDPDPDPDGTVAAASAQVTALDTLLDSSTADRARVGAAVNAVQACDSGGSSWSVLSDAAQHRDALVSRLDALSVDLIDGGAEAVVELRSGWQESAEADRAFAAWALASLSCTGSDDVTLTADYRSGVLHSGRATAAKTRFLDRWNTVAATYGLYARAENEL
jgi:hypothetical protein